MLLNIAVMIFQEKSICPVGITAIWWIHLVTFFGIGWQDCPLYLVDYSRRAKFKEILLRDLKTVKEMLLLLLLLYLLFPVSAGMCMRMTVTNTVFTM